MWRKVVKIGKKYDKYYIFLRKKEIEKLEKMFNTTIDKLRFNATFRKNKMVLEWRKEEKK